MSRDAPLLHLGLDDDRQAEVTTLFARAFHLDPPFQWLFEDPLRRAEALARVFNGLVPLHAKYARAFVALDRGQLVGGSLWAPCGQHFGVLDYLRHGLLGLLRCGVRPVLRMLQLDQQLVDTLAEHAEPSDLYLNTIGVLPERQGQGIGSQMLTHHLSCEWAAGRDVWLWTNSDANERLYTRHGFVTIVSREYPDPRGFRARLMHRAAGSSALIIGERSRY